MGLPMAFPTPENIKNKCKRRLIAFGSKHVDLFDVIVAVSSKLYLLLPKIVTDIFDICPRLLKTRFSKIDM